MWRGRRVTHPLTAQARSLSALNGVLELGDTCWRLGLAQHQPQDQEAGRASSTHDSGYPAGKSGLAFHRAARCSPVGTVRPPVSQPVLP